MKKLLFFLMIGWVALASSCKKESPPEFLYGVPLTFKFRLLNEAGKEATEFKQGQNITFNLLMTNYSNNRWDFLASRLPSDYNFLRVFQVVNATDSLDLGQPYDRKVWCSDYDVAIKPNETFDLKFNWASDSTQISKSICGMRGTNKMVLPIGKYKTGFTYRFQFTEGDSFRISKPIRFDLDFSVK